MKRKIIILIFAIICSIFSIDSSKAISVNRVDLNDNNRSIGAIQGERYIRYIDDKYTYILSNGTATLPSLKGIKILRTVYSYYQVDGKNHRVDVIQVKEDGKETWEETIRSYKEAHSFKKEYNSHYYKIGDYGYYSYDFICSKCKYKKKGGVDKVYIGPGKGLPEPKKLDIFEI